MAILALFQGAGAALGASIPVPSLDINKTFVYANGDPNDITCVEASNDGANWVRIVAATNGAVWLTQVPSTKHAFLRTNRLNSVGINASCFVAANDVNVAAQLGPAGAPPFATIGVLSGWLSTPTNTPTVAASWQVPPNLAAGIIAGAIQVEVNVAYRATVGGQCGSRKLTASIRANAGSLLVDSQQSNQQNDNAVFAANIAALISVTGTTIQVTVTGLVTLVVDWNVNGILNQAV